jgi:hypothetical protein
MITPEQLLDVFAAYNAQIWPMLIVAYLLGLAAVILAVHKTAYSNRVIPGVLALFWLWVSLPFWLPSAIQGFALGYLFAAVFLIQGALFVAFTVRPRLEFALHKDSRRLAGLIFLLYALLGYPLVGLLINHWFPYAPPFGLAPCPLVTFTFGLLLLSERGVPKVLWFIPFLYSLSGILWVCMGVVEDVGMVASGLAGAWFLWPLSARHTPISDERVSRPESEPAWSLDLPDEL